MAKTGMVLQTLTQVVWLGHKFVSV